MKAAIGGFLMISIVIWMVWTLLGKTNCEQVARVVTPINLVTMAIREVSANWVDKETKLDELIWSGSVRDAAEKVVARTFYSESLKCSWGNNK